MADPDEVEVVTLPLFDVVFIYFEFWPHE